MPLIYSDEHIQAFYRKGRSGPIFIFFSELTFRPDGRHFWGETIANRLDLECVAFVATSQNWYPEGAMRRAIAAVKTFLLDRQTIAYAASMGAYAAIRYAEALGTSVTLAVAPQWSIAPDKAPYERRFSRFHTPSHHRDMEIARDSDYFARENRLLIAYDPMDPLDRVHAERIFLANPRAIPLRIPYIGHPAIFAFSGTSLIESIFDLLTHDNPSAIQSLLRKSKKDTLPYLKGLLSATIMRGHHRWAEFLLARIKTCVPDLISCLYDMIIEAQLIEDHLQVVALSKTLISLDEKHIEAYHRAGFALRALEDPGRAATLLAQAAKIFPAEKHLHGHLGIALQENGQSKEAIVAFDAALSLDPALSDLMRRKLDCEQKL